jgi:hypothetical protein
MEKWKEWRKFRNNLYYTYCRWEVFPMNVTYLKILRGLQYIYEYSIMLILYLYLRMNIEGSSHKSASIAQILFNYVIFEIIIRIEYQLLPPYLRSPVAEIIVVLLQPSMNVTNYECSVFFLRYNDKRLAILTLWILGQK